MSLQMNEKMMKIFLKEHQTKTGLIKCNCGRRVKLDNILYVHPIDLNFMDFWFYELLDEGESKKTNKTFPTKRRYNTRKYPLRGRLCMVPGIGWLLSKFHDWFHKPKPVFVIECKYCIDENVQEFDLEEDDND